MSIVELVGEVIAHLADSGITAVGPLLSLTTVSGGVVVSPPRVAGEAEWQPGDTLTWTVDVLVVGTGQDQSQVAELLRRADDVLAALADDESPVWVQTAGAVVTTGDVPAYQITCQH